MSNTPEGHKPADIVENIMDVVSAGDQAAASIAASSSLTERDLLVGALQHSVGEVGIVVTDTFNSGPDPEIDEPWKTGMTRADIVALRGLPKAVRTEMLIGVFKQRRAAKASKRNPVK